MTTETKTTARVFKSRMAYLRIVLDSELEAVFRKHRLVTTDSKLIEKLEHLVKTDKNVGVFIDPNESTTDQLPPGTDNELRQQQIQEFLESRTTTFDGGTMGSNSSQLGIASSADVAAKAGATPNYSANEIQNALKTRMAAATAAKPT